MQCLMSPVGIFVFERLWELISNLDDPWYVSCDQETSYYSISGAHTWTLTRSSHWHIIFSTQLVNNQIILYKIAGHSLFSKDVRDTLGTEMETISAEVRIWVWQISFKGQVWTWSACNRRTDSLTFNITHNSVFEFKERNNVPGDSFLCIFFSKKFLVNNLG